MSIIIDNKIKKNKEEVENSNFNFQSLLNFLNKDFTFIKKGLNDKKKESFYSELSILLTSGIDIKTSLEIIVEEQTKESDKKLFTTLYQTILNGSSLSDAMYDSGVFSAYEYFSIKIGEESGRISDILTELKSFYRRKITQKRQLVSAFTYPFLVVVTAIGAVVFMLNFIVPMFVDVFKRFNGELPALTKFIISLSNTMSSNIIFFMVLITAIVIWVIIVRGKNKFRDITSKLLVKVPVFGSLIYKIYLTRFCHSMALLSVSKTPLLKSIQLVQKMINFYPYEQALIVIENDILHGMMLNESMSKFHFFDKRTISLIKVGEEVNQLDKIFEQLNSQFSEEIEHQINILGSLLEPIMIILVGIMVAVILIAMYLPLFQISSSIF